MRSNQVHSPFPTGVQEDHAQCSLLLLHAEQDPLHTHTVVGLIRLRGINSDQVVPASVVVAVTRVVKEP